MKSKFSKRQFCQFFSRLRLSLGFLLIYSLTRQITAF